MRPITDGPSKVMTKGLRRPAPIKLGDLSFEPDPATRELVIGTMDRWLAGEPVLSYEQIIEKWGGGFEDLLRAMHRSRHYQSFSKLWALRYEWIGRFGFMIPCREIIDACVELQPIVEVAAGTGFMTRLMRNAGVDVIGTDVLPRGETTYSFCVGGYDEQQIAAQAKTMVRREPKRTVFCSWPCYQRTWFRQMLKAMSVGQTLIVTRESATAEETAWDYLSSCFGQIAMIDIPNWNGMHDRGEVWIKKRPTPRHLIGRV